MINYFQVLGLQFGASTEEVRKAYREYAKHFHPDKHQNSAFFTDRFRSIQEAYELLIDKAKREQFEQSFQGEKLRELSKALAEEKRKASVLIAELTETEAKCNRLLSENAELVKRREKRNVFSRVLNKTKNNWKPLAKWASVVTGASLVVYKLIHPSLTNLEVLQKESDSMLDIINDKPKSVVRQADSLFADKTLIVAGLQQRDSKSRILVADIFSMRGYAKHVLSNDTGAVRDFTKAASLGNCSDDARLYKLRGEARLELGDTTGALQDFGTSISLLSEKNRAYEDRADVLFSRKVYSKALQDYKMAVSTKPGEGALLNRLGNCYFAVNRLDSACVTWRRAGEQGDGSAFENIKNFCR